MSKKRRSLIQRERFYTLNVGEPGGEPVYLNCAGMTRRSHDEAKQFDSPTHPGLLEWLKEHGAGEIVRVTLTIERVRPRKVNRPARRATA